MATDIRHPATGDVPKPMIRIRRMLPGDRNYVLATWKRSYIEREKVPRRLVRMVCRGIEAMVDTLAIFVAYSASHESTILGWSCDEWSYIPPELRGTVVEDELEKVKNQAA